MVEVRTNDDLQIRPGYSPKKPRRDQRMITPTAEAYPRPNEVVTPGIFGSTFPITVANGVTAIFHTKPGAGDVIRRTVAKLGAAIQADPHSIDVLKAHYIRFLLFDDDTRFIYLAVFDGAFDQYWEDVVKIFNSLGGEQVPDYLVGCPENWREDTAAFARFVREHQASSIAEYTSYPGASVADVVKALEVKQAFTTMLDNMQ